MAAATGAALNPAEEGSHVDADCARAHADPGSRDDIGGHRGSDPGAIAGETKRRHPKTPDPEFEHALRLQMAVITGE